MAIPCHDVNILLRDGLRARRRFSRKAPIRLWRRRGGDAAGLRRVGNLDAAVVALPQPPGLAVELHASADARTADRMRLRDREPSTSGSGFRSHVPRSGHLLKVANRKIGRALKNKVRLKTDCVMVALSKEVNRYFWALKTSNVWNFMA